MPNTNTSRYYHPSSRTYSYTHKEYSTTELLRDPRKRATYYEMVEYFYNFLDVCQDKSLRHYLIEVLERNNYTEMLNAYDRLLETYEKLHPFEDLSLDSKSQFNSLIGITLIAIVMAMIWFFLGYFDEQRQSPQFFSSKPTVSDAYGNPSTVLPDLYPDFQAEFMGKIGTKLQIKMFLRANKGKIYGFYFYTKFRRNIRLEGQITEEGQIVMDGSTREEGHVDIFRIKLTKAGKLYGTWHDANDETRELLFSAEKI
ncbi:hypothetical protein [Candidatus Albibeggiatoa sp. nov. NOAA]|uniref:hypothetical protein n=1 Tax=Candidatus Albibeggiatoa sp. nov. NOAA TaxID=3162724 RepID=UPI0032FE83E1|nr:hypothetical protein [Thiotrichaceae bacterium]